MSSRTKKTTVTRTTTTSGGSSTSVSTPQSGGSSTSRSPGRVRPPSPTMISRIEEKNALAHLNDRLAAYIDKVRSLEAENLRLSTQIRSQEETITRETGNIKALYESELADARKLLDETAKEKAKLQLDLGKANADADQWREKYHRADRELGSTSKKLLAAEGQVNDLQARLNDAVNQRKHWENEYNKVKVELMNLEKQLATAKKQLEEETIARVDLENRVQSLKEELAFKNQLHETELNETRTRTDITIEEVDGSIRAEYEHKLADALRQMREDAEFTIRSTREETEESFYTKLDELKLLADRGDRAAMATREELRTCRRRIDELTGQMEGLKAQNAMYEQRIKELEGQLVREGEDHERQLSIRDAEIRKLRETLEEHMREYRDLMDIKIALDMEIAAYRKLLESEEVRLNLSQSESPGRSTPMRQTAGGRKRKRLAESALGSAVTESHSSDAFSASSSAKGEVEISETDGEGKFIKLYNTSEKDVALGSWQLKHTAGDQETTFKFHRTLHVKPGAYVTVWSSDAEATHSPPTDIVMKGQRWFVSDAMTSRLLNTEGEEMASREMKKMVYRTTLTTHRTSTSSEGSDAVSFPPPLSSFLTGRRPLSVVEEGDGQRDEKCSIM